MSTVTWHLKSYWTVSLIWYQNSKWTELAFKNSTHRGYWYIIKHCIGMHGDLQSHNVLLSEQLYEGDFAIFFFFFLQNFIKRIYDVIKWFILNISLVCTKQANTQIIGFDWDWKTLSLDLKNVYYIPYICNIHL